jgi:hypothetical protein
MAQKNAVPCNSIEMDALTTVDSLQDTVPHVRRSTVFVFVSFAAVHSIDAPCVRSQEQELNLKPKGCEKTEEKLREVSSVRF